MENNERDQMFDENQQGQYMEDDVRRESGNENRWQDGRPESDEIMQNTENDDRTERGQQQNPQTPQSSNTDDKQENSADEIRTDFAGDGFRRDANPDNDEQGKRPFSDEKRDVIEENDQDDREQQPNRQTTQSSNNDDDQENSADEIRTDFAGDGFRRDANPDNDEQSRQPLSEDRRDDTGEEYRADRDQRKDYQTPTSVNPEYDRPSNPLPDQSENESNEEIPRTTESPIELPDRDQDHGFRVPVSEN
jgi:hypothetical protein